ncbi:class I SAM-dependent methyltransferase [Paraburkholderia azotifigens]|uniref:class I SAM-dependent methyltransferase n=1 Tax=Paraburkholderia azotifigens TaxID=2057004 RepID=UPI0020807B25|nr:class I SAM-dependent methyltransferase [Paraburkholderia hospita]
MQTEFTAHNIRLQDGTLTMPDLGWTIDISPWFLGARRVLNYAFDGKFLGKRIADLGCLEGGYTVEFARMGFEAVGVEVRDSNIANCNFVKERVGLANLSFVQDDVWNVGKYGKFDAIFCCGLLYHLDRPREFIQEMAKIASKIIIINTHYAAEETIEKFNLSDITEHEGLPGRWYAEHDVDDRQQLDSLKWTSWSNKKSFWLTKGAILQTLQSSGFDLVFEQFDWLGSDILDSLSSGYYKQDCRGTFVGIRSA